MYACTEVHNAMYVHVLKYIIQCTCTEVHNAMYVHVLKYIMQCTCTEVHNAMYVHVLKSAMHTENVAQGGKTGSLQNLGGGGGEVDTMY